MPEIQLLDEATIEKIAAGEVVERPSSIAKELVENSIDAGATHITVELKDGGISFLRITDNGCGIEKNQVRIAFLRHATSKIRNVSDLMSVKSLGFRGEALASVSAVAQVELITRTRSSLTGVRFVIEGSKEKSFEEIGAPEGTTFIVRNLFYNTPVRRKFLKSAQTEAGYVATMIERLAMSHPEISFQLIINGQQKLHTSGNCNRKDIIFHIYGKDIAMNLIAVDAENEEIKVSGFIGKPHISRSNRNFETYYMNGRYMKSNVISKAIEQAYQPYLMNHQYPFVVLNIEMSEDLYDVNVHPTKMDVRFANGEQLYQVLIQLLRNALEQKDLIPEVSVGKEKTKEKIISSEPLAPQPFEKSRISEIKHTIAQNSVYEPKYENKIPGTTNEPEYRTNAPVKEVPETKQEDVRPQQMKLTDLVREDNGFMQKQTDFLEQVRRSNVRIIGQLFETYWLVEAEEKLFIIDQHAAHEKVLFERNMKAFENRTYTSQQLSPPIILSLTTNEQQALLTHRKELGELGFEISEFGGNEFAICAVPDNLMNLDAKLLFTELLDDCVERPGSGKTTSHLLWNKVASASCKAAIKGNERISVAQMEELILELLSLQNPYHCPHGRPTMISMDKYEIEKKFKRII
ncbi:MAG: DNA mismatch repair endonuclease MutL [bacterium]|nr:DNA mismatch repair endonuclease MutL [bacterium]